MLQTFLLEFIPATEEGLTLGVPLAILLVLLRRLPFAEVYTGNFRTALKWGFWLSIFIVAVRFGTRNAVSREMLEFLSTVISLSGEIIILARLFKPSESEDPPLKLAVAAIVVALFMYHGFEIWLLPAGAVTAALGDYFTLEFLVKMLGFVTGALFAFLSSFMVYKAADALNDSRLKFVFVVQIAACMIQQLIFLVQVMMARGLLTGEFWMDLMAPVINYSGSLIFVIFAAILVLPITLFSQPRPEKLPEQNPAQYRKVLANAIQKRRWGGGIIAALILMTTTSTAGSYVANQEEEIIPAIPVDAEDGSVDVDLEVVNDGHLHRFVYRASTGEMVRYIVILKGGSAYGVGLDACEICGTTGYYERDNQVICNLCDVQMNKATIGTAGGCNPIPIAYSIADGRLKVPQAELESKAQIFE